MQNGQFQNNIYYMNVLLLLLLHLPLGTNKVLLTWEHHRTGSSTCKGWGEAEEEEDGWFVPRVSWTLVLAPASISMLMMSSFPVHAAKDRMCSPGAHKFNG